MPFSRPADLWRHLLLLSPRVQVLGNNGPDCWGTLFALTGNHIQNEGASECAVTLEVNLGKFQNLENKNACRLIKILHPLTTRILVIVTISIFTVSHTSHGSLEGKWLDQGHWGLCNMSEQICSLHFPGVLCRSSVVINDAISPTWQESQPFVSGLFPSSRLEVFQNGWSGGLFNRSGTFAEMPSADLSPLATRSSTLQMSVAQGQTVSNGINSLPTSLHGSCSKASQWKWEVKFIFFIFSAPVCRSGWWATFSVICLQWLRSDDKSDF